jgi:ribosome-binding factor A
MESKRQLKVSKQIQKDLGEIFQNEVRHLAKGAFLTIVDVTMSPDLSVAKIYISLLGAADKELVMASINDGKKEVRKHLGLKVGKQMRIVPELAFFLHEGAEYAQKMEKILKNLDIPKDEGEK